MFDSSFAGKKPRSEGRLKPIFQGIMALIPQKQNIRKFCLIIKSTFTDETVFLKRFMVLLSGAVLAQALPIAIAPALSRLFSPEQLGAWGLFAATISICATLATLCYESALLLPEDDKDAAALVCFSTATAIAFSFILFVVCLIWGPSFLSRLNLGSIKSLWPWIPIGVALVSIYQVLSSWSIRSLKFSDLALARINQSATMATLQLSAGLFKIGTVGLLAGQVFSYASSLVIMVKNLWKKDKDKFIGVDIDRVKHAAITYRRFPFFALPASLTGVLANSLPLFLIGSYFGPTMAGFYTLTQRVLAAPVALVGNALLDVFKERAASDYREHGSCRKIYLRVFGVLLAIAVPPSVILFFWAPNLFALVFGEGWREAGEYASLLSPLLLIRFVSSPLSYVLYIAQKQNVDLVWQLFLLPVGVTAMVVGGLHSSPRLGIGLFSGGFSLMYMIYIGLSYHYAKAHPHQSSSPA